MTDDTDPIVWKGDPEHTQFATWNGLIAGVYDSPLGIIEFAGSPITTQLAFEDGVWQCCVSEKHTNRYVFMTTDYNMRPLSADGARWLCEYVMRAHHYSRLAAELADAVRDRDAWLSRFRNDSDAYRLGREEVSAAALRVVDDMLAGRSGGKPTRLLRRVRDAVVKAVGTRISE